MSGWVGGWVGGCVGERASERVNVCPYPPARRPPAANVTKASYLIDENGHLEMDYCYY